MSDDFAEYEAPSSVISVATAATIQAISSVLPAGSTPVPASFATPAPFPDNSPWYAIWERHTLSEFTIELYVFLLLGFVVTIHAIGVSRNRRIAREWIAKHRSVLEEEFALVGFDALGRANTLPTDADAVLDSLRPEPVLLKEKSTNEFVAYATGRRNIAFLHITISLMKRNNPLGLVGEFLASFIFDGFPAPADTVTITLSPFDGNEAQLGKPTVVGGGSSKFDNFIWAIVNKATMSRWRDERYDLSLTTTKDWDGLPRWTSVMTEQKEIGDLVLTKELRDAVEKVGEEGGFEYLVVSDQRIDKPQKLEETIPKKRASLHLTIPTTIFSLFNGPVPLSDTAPLLSATIRLIDHLVAVAHFRPEVSRKLKATREEQSRALLKASEEEKAEERDQKRAEEKKKERDAKLRSLTADEQKKFLEKEKEKEMRKSAKKQARRA
ncbi:hypothetical protein DFH27DRAFT_603555 [Peziza echinospora]|nr:hypothetical protein DFH27DRAFT_603555 [Peziza echinospora]